MRDQVLLEQFLIAVTVRSDLPEEEVNAARKILNVGGFRKELQKAVEKAGSQFEELRKLKFEVSV